MSYVATHGWGRIYLEEVATIHVTASQPRGLYHCQWVNTTPQGYCKRFRGSSEDAINKRNVQDQQNVQDRQNVQDQRNVQDQQMFRSSRMFGISSLSSSSGNTCHVIGIASWTMTAWRQFGSIGSHESRLVTTVKRITKERITTSRWLT